MQALWLYALTVALPMPDEGFHMIAFAVCALAMLGYLCMALGLGDTMVDGRTVYFARYCDWSFTTPLILTDVGFLFKLNYTDIFGICVWDILMILSGLFSALSSHNSVKFPLYCFSCVCFCFVAGRLWFVFGEVSKTRNKAFNRRCRMFLTLMFVVWLGYPIVWMLAEGNENPSPVRTLNTQEPKLSASMRKSSCTESSTFALSEFCRNRISYVAMAYAEPCLRARSLWWTYQLSTAATGAKLTRRMCCTRNGRGKLPFLYKG